MCCVVCRVVCCVVCCSVCCVVRCTWFVAVVRYRLAVVCWTLLVGGIMCFVCVLLYDVTGVFVRCSLLFVVS